MAVGAKVDVSTVAVAVTTPPTQGTGCYVAVRNRGAGAVYLGDSDVDADGYDLQAGEGIVLQLDKGEELFAVAPVGDAVLRTIRVEGSS